MSQEDPFAEPDDGEKTVIRPNPGGRRPVWLPLRPPLPRPPRHRLRVGLPM